MANCVTPVTSVLIGLIARIDAFSGCRRLDPIKVTRILIVDPLSHPVRPRRLGP